MIRYTNATDSPDERVDYPEIVDELRELGFRQVGRMLAEPTDGGYEAIADGYAGSARERFLAHCDVPMPVLASPEGDCFADVSWFWDSPAVRFRTLLTDGALAETQRLWNGPPEVPEVLGRYWKNWDVASELTNRSAPEKGRSIEVIATADSAEQWARHREHVAAYAASRRSVPAKHETIDDAISISYSAFRHDEVVQRRTSGLWAPLLVAYGVFAVAVVLLTATAGQRGFAIALAVVFMFSTRPVLRLIVGRVRSLPGSWRPPFL